MPATSGNSKKQKEHHKFLYHCLPLSSNVYQSFCNPIQGFSGLNESYPVVVCASIGSSLETPRKPGRVPGVRLRLPILGMVLLCRINQKAHIEPAILKRVSFLLSEISSFSLYDTRPTNEHSFRIVEAPGLPVASSSLFIWSN